jgi:hypothetical protein
MRLVVRVMFMPRAMIMMVMSRLMIHPQREEEMGMDVRLPIVPRRRPRMKVRRRRELPRDISRNDRCGKEGAKHEVPVDFILRR